MERESGPDQTENTKISNSCSTQEAKETPVPQADQPQSASEAAIALEVQQAEVPCEQNTLQEVERESQPVRTNLADQHRKTIDIAAGYYLRDPLPMATMHMREHDDLPSRKHLPRQHRPGLFRQLLLQL